MEVKQIYEIVNDSLTETLGKDDLIQEDLTGIVDAGNEIFNANAFDRFVRSLINHIGKVVFVNRPYSGSAPSVMMDDWRYGSILEKIGSRLPEATENQSWELTDGHSYDPNIFHKPDVYVKFFNKMTTFQIERSVQEKSLYQSFSSATQLNAFLSMLLNEVEKGMTVAFDNLIMRTINNMIAETFYDFSSAGTYTGAGNARCINLLSRYNTQYGAQLTAQQAILNPDFIRYAAYQMALTIDRLTRMSTLFNMGGMERFTPKDYQHVVMLSEFRAAADVFLQSNTFHDEYTKLINAETIPFWQGSGTNFAFADTGTIKVKTSENHEVEATGILGAIFDRDALGVNGYNSRVDTHWNEPAEFTNYWYKRDARYFNDFNENMVVFYVA